MQHCPLSFLIPVALALLVTSHAADAQPPGKVYRIGVFNMGPAPSAAEWQQSPFLQEPLLPTSPRESRFSIA